MTISSKRVESFSDNVIGIIITIMVFQLRFPRLTAKFTQYDVWHNMLPLLPHFIAYAVSFIVVGVMWVNHHHMFHLVQKVDEKLLWLNLHMLFWMSLIPFPTAMLGDNPFLPQACMMYGVVMLMNTVAFRIIRLHIIRHELMYKENEDKRNSAVDEVNYRVKIKNLVSIVAYVISIPLSYVSVYAAYACFMVLPAMFFIPDGVRTRLDPKPEPPKEAQ